MSEEVAIQRTRLHGVAEFLGEVKDWMRRLESTVEKVHQDMATRAQVEAVKRDVDEVRKSVAAHQPAVDAVPDHERRIRALERRAWIALGVLAVVGFLGWQGIRSILVNEIQAALEAKPKATSSRSR